ncbi:MAG: RNA-binding protein [Acidobacteria bacterium]|nr:MAG: RNA-binding protein [Acidobacteriota bacterium]
MKSVYVGNLSAGATEQTVRALFEVYGTVERVHIVTDRETGQPKGFAFVEMVSDAEAEKAIASVNGQDSGGKTLAVSEARPKKMASARPTQSRGRFGNEAPSRPDKRQILT